MSSSDVVVAPTSCLSGGGKNNLLQSTNFHWVIKGIIFVTTKSKVTTSVTMTSRLEGMRSCFMETS